MSKDTIVAKVRDFQLAIRFILGLLYCVFLWRLPVSRPVDHKIGNQRTHSAPKGLVN